jgi:hypothetical protein
MSEVRLLNGAAIDRYTHTHKHTHTNTNTHTGSDTAQQYSDSAGGGGVEGGSGGGGGGGGGGRGEMFVGGSGYRGRDSEVGEIDRELEFERELIRSVTRGFFHGHVR